MPHNRIKPWRKPDGKTVLLIRYGGIGDMIMASSVLRALKKDGWHVTFNTTPMGADLLRHDPHVDAFLVQDKDQVPNHWLRKYWDGLAERYDKVVNLSESCEGNLLMMKGRSNHLWPDAVRRQMVGRINYVEFQHQVAEVAFEHEPRFYPSAAEKGDAVRAYPDRDCRQIGFVLAGSSIHKVWPWVGDCIHRLLRETDARLFTFGGIEEWLLEEAIAETVLTHAGVGQEQFVAAMRRAEIPASRQTKGGPVPRITRADKRYRGWLSEKIAEQFGDQRIVFTSGDWKIRRSMTHAAQLDVIVGPETGMMNSVCMEPVAKVLMLSHSSHENLTRDWRNTFVLMPDTRKVPCYPCHRLHHDRSFCFEDKETGASICAATMGPDEVFDAILECCERAGRPMSLDAAVKAPLALVDGATA